MPSFWRCRVHRIIYVPHAAHWQLFASYVFLAVTRSRRREPGGTLAFWVCQEQGLPLDDTRRIGVHAPVIQRDGRSWFENVLNASNVLIIITAEQWIACRREVRATSSVGRPKSNTQADGDAES